MIETIGFTEFNFACGALLFFFGVNSFLRPRKAATSPPPKPASFSQFTDPFADGKDFDPSLWEFVRHSDSDFEFIEKDQQVFSLQPENIFDRNKSVIAHDSVCRGSLATYCKSNSAEETSNAFEKAALNGAAFYSHISANRGCVPNDYGGPLFLLPGLIISAYVCGEEAKLKILPASHRKAMAQYILNHQQADGGWGTHISSSSTNFGSTLNYVALRLLGIPLTHPACAKARLFLSIRNNGAQGSPLWAKVWLCILGLYSYEALPTSVPPEMFLLPDWFPFHPGKTWCHARMVALPMAHLYGSRFVYPHCEEDPVIAQLRVELYPGKPYSQLSSRSGLSSGEIYAAEPTWLLETGDFLLRWILEPLVFRPLLRRRALKQTRRLIREEDETNNYICIGPVNKALNMVCCFASGDSKAVDLHIQSMYRYLWVAEDGMKMQGYLNSMVWDSSFCLRALTSLGTERNVKFAQETRDFLLKNQVDKNPAATQQYRDPFCQGGWGFSTKENSYIVSDCTGEALLAVIPQCDQLSILVPAVELILWMQQDSDGAWASYEKQRGYTWYEVLNPAAMFDNIMIDYSYVECTSSCMQALSAFVKKFPTHEHAPRCKSAVLKGVSYLLQQQREDGSFFGQWGVCFLYAGFFASEALATSLSFSSTKDSITQALARLAAFTLEKQNPDGGWGESVEACALKKWVPDPNGSNVVSTSWALLTLVRIGKFTPIDSQAISRAAWFLVKAQFENGDWPQPRMISGVFNKTCGITYTSYRNIFPMWALSEASKVVQQ